MRLSEYARSRDNNFTLLRLLAAFAVVLAHSWSALGIDGRDFAYDYVGREIAEMALDMLFVTSGFLVTGKPVQSGRPHPFPVGPARSGCSRQCGSWCRSPCSSSARR